MKIKLFMRYKGFDTLIKNFKLETTCVKFIQAEHKRRTGTTPDIALEFNNSEAQVKSPLYGYTYIVVKEENEDE